MVRSAGFPVHGVLHFQDVRLANAADLLIASGAADRQERENFDTLWLEHTEARQSALAGIVRQPAFLLALTWQNPRLLESAITPLLAQIARNEPRSRKRRIREQLVAAYWQRYCTKSESIGFFGPTTWATVGRSGPPVTTSHGPSLVDEATVFLESWSIDRLAQRLGSDIDLRPWLAPRRAPHIQVCDGVVVLPDGRREKVDRLTEAALSRADGRTIAADLIEQLAARFPEASSSDVHETLVGLRLRSWLIWKFELSPTLRPEDELRSFLNRIAVPARTPALTALDTIERARDAVADAWMDPDRLKTALSGLDQAFADVTGHAATTRNDGLAYGGRTLAYLECRRDLAVDLGAGLVQAMAPLSLVLDSVRWMLYQVRLAVMAYVRDAYRTLVPETGAPNAAAPNAAPPKNAAVPNATMLWRACAPLLGGGLRAIVENVLVEVHARWGAILRIPDGASAATFRFEDLRSAVSDLFDAPEAGWTDARWCSPDVMIAAVDEKAIRCGDFHLVLGEIHAAVNTFDYRSMVSLHPRPSELAACIDDDHPSPRLLIALPRESRPRLTTRSHPEFIRDIDHHLVLMPHIPIPTRGRVCLGSDVPVVADGDGLDLVMSDGSRFDVMDMFSSAVKAEVAQAFDLYPPGHRPRIVVDAMTIARQRWTLPANEMDFADVPDEAGRFAACRRWMRARGLPRQVFVKSPLETKPFYVDFASPAYVELLASAARKVAREDRDATLGIVEMLPELGDTWLADAEGNRYVAEFRFVAFDTRPAAAVRPPRVAQLKDVE